MVGDEMAMPTSDDMYFSSRTQSDNKINDISHYRYNSGNDWVEYLWRMKYQGIDRANTAILGISGMPDFASDPDLRRLEGEARFLRAFLTFDLIKYWGEVPSPPNRLPVTIRRSVRVLLTTNSTIS